jgi:hypothetical protein
MSGPGGNNSGNSQQLQNWLQQFPQASSGTAAANPQASAVNPFLQRLAALQGSPGAQLTGQGMGLMRAGQQPMPQAPMPRTMPTQMGGPPMPQAAGRFQSAQPTITPQMMNPLLMRGLMGQ